MSDRPIPDREQIEADLVALAPDLRAFARTFHRDPARADDLVQEAILKAWTNLDKFKPGTNLRAWLFTILRNTFLSEMRKRKREVEDADGALVAGLAEKPRQESALELQDFRDALNLLPDDQREAIILVGAAGFSYEEASAICGCAPGTVKSRVSRARKRLSELMRLSETDAIGEDALIAAAIDAQGNDRNVA